MQVGVALPPLPLFFAPSNQGALLAHQAPACACPASTRLLCVPHHHPTPPTAAQECMAKLHPDNFADYPKEKEENAKNLVVGGQAPGAGAVWYGVVCALAAMHVHVGRHGPTVLPPAFPRTSPRTSAQVRPSRMRMRSCCPAHSGCGSIERARVVAATPAAAPHLPARRMWCAVMCRDLESELYMLACWLAD